MEIAETGNPTRVKVSELEQAARAASKFEVSVTFELSTGELHTFRIRHSEPPEFDGEVVGAKGRFMRHDLNSVMQSLIDWAGKMTKMNALTVKLTSDHMSAKELRPIAIAAWAEIAGLPCPKEEDVGKAVQTAKEKQLDKRNELIADLHNGSEGLRRFHSRSKAENAIARHLQETDLSGLDLAGLRLTKSGILDLRKSNLSNANLTNAQLLKCDLSDCDLSNATVDGANFQSADCSDSKFFKASMENAVMRGTTLRNTDLSHANLSKADLSFADLRGANLSTANLKDVAFFETVYDEHTKWPADFVPAIPDPVTERGVRFFLFKGEGRDPFLVQQVQAMVSEGGSIDFNAFVARLDKEFDQARLKKALKMLQAERFQLFAEVAPDSLVGVVKSQTDASLVYSCRITQSGSYACCTQNLNACGGLRGALCKHLLVLLIGITRGGELDPSLACEWVLGSKQHRNAVMDKDVMTATLLRYKGAEAGEIDWRPTETMPEDYYAF